MGWWETLLSAICGGGVITMLYDLFSVRPRLKAARADARKAETEAADASVKYLVDRIESVERLYKEQGELLDGFRKRQLEIEKELSEKNSKIASLEGENRALKAKVDKLEKESAEYKRTNGSLSEKVERLKEEIEGYRSKPRTGGARTK